MPGLTPEEQAFFESGGDASHLQPAPAPGVQGVQDLAPPAPAPIDVLANNGLGTDSPAPAPAPVPAPAPAPVAPPAPDLNQVMEALRQSQAQAAALAAQIEAAQKPPPAPAPVAPDPTVDPLGSMLHQLATVNKNVADLQNALVTQQQQQSQMVQFQRFQQQVVAMRDQFAIANPDFPEAYDHLRNARMADLRTFGVPEADIPKQLFQEEIVLSESAIKVGKNPAEAIYEMARRHGYATKTPAPVAGPAPAPAPVQSKLSLVKGAPPAVPNLPRTPAPADITAESLRDATDADLNKLVQDPAAWAKIAGGDNIPL